MYCQCAQPTEQTGNQIAYIGKFYGAYMGGAIAAANKVTTDRAESGSVDSRHPARPRALLRFVRTRPQPIVDLSETARGLLRETLSFAADLALEYHPLSTSVLPTRATSCGSHQPPNMKTW